MFLACPAIRHLGGRLASPHPVPSSGSAERSTSGLGWFHSPGMNRHTGGLVSRGARCVAQPVHLDYANLGKASSESLGRRYSWQKLERASLEQKGGAVPTFNPTAWEAEKGLYEFKASQHSKLWVSQGYTVRPCLKQTKTTKQYNTKRKLRRQPCGHSPGGPLILTGLWLPMSPLEPVGPGSSQGSTLSAE